MGLVACHHRPHLCYAINSRAGIWYVTICSTFSLRYRCFCASSRLHTDISTRVYLSSASLATLGRDIVDVRQHYFMPVSDERRTPWCLLQGPPLPCRRGPQASSKHVSYSEGSSVLCLFSLPLRIAHTSFFSVVIVVFPYIYECGNRLWASWRERSLIWCYRGRTSLPLPFLASCSLVDTLLLMVNRTDSLLPGESEYWFALIKVILIIMFIIVGLIYDWGGVIGHPGPVSAPLWRVDHVVKSMLTIFLFDIDFLA